MPFLIAIAALLAAAQAPDAGAIGQRTDTPERLFSGIGQGSSDAVLDDEIAAAAAYPLGSQRNPVRVGGPEGERAYLGRLRCSDGARPKIGPRGDGGVGAFGSLVSVFALDCGSALPAGARVMLDMYHEEHREDRAPAGFTITPR